MRFSRGYDPCERRRLLDSQQDTSGLGSASTRSNDGGRVTTRRGSEVYLAAPTPGRPTAATASAANQNGSRQNEQSQFNECRPAPSRPGNYQQKNAGQRESRARSEIACVVRTSPEPERAARAGCGGNLQAGSGGCCGGAEVHGKREDEATRRVIRGHGRNASRESDRASEAIRSRGGNGRRADLAGSPDIHTRRVRRDAELPKAWDGSPVVHQVRRVH